METEQFNIRLNKALLYDIEFIAQKYNVDRYDWLRTKLAEMIMHEKEMLIGRINENYVQGHISDGEYEMSMGLKPTEGLRDSRLETAKMRAAKLRADPEECRKLFEEHTLKALDTEVKGKKLHYDKHMKKVMKKIEKT